MADRFDIIVVGAGTMGLAASAYLSQAGLKVLALDQYSVPNDLASHSGYTRIIRKAYFEHPDYVPLLQRSYDLWQSLEQSTAQRIYHETGILYMGERDSSVLKGCKSSGAQYHIPLTLVDRISYQKAAYPFTIDAGWESFIEPQAGYLDVNTALECFKKTAITTGSIIKNNEKVLSWHRQGEDIIIKTNTASYTSEKIIFTSGAWTQSLLSNYNLPLKVTRQILAWVQVSDQERFRSPDFPCWFIHDRDYGMFYGFPIPHFSQPQSPQGIKIALHVPGLPTDPDRVNTQILDSDHALMAYFLQHYLPQLQSSLIEYKTCLYTNTPDEHFIIDYLPDTDDKVIVACGFSGHGFKFAPAVGQIVSYLAQGQQPDLNCSFLRLSRFIKAPVHGT